MNAAVAATTASRQHPLDPLTGEEIEAAARIFRCDAAEIARPRFVSIEREEPPKQLILEFSDGEEIDRRAFLVVRDAATGQTFEAVVSLTDGRLVVLDAVAAVQSAGIEEDFALVERLVKEDPRWQAAMRTRGVENFTHVCRRVARGVSRRAGRAHPPAEPPAHLCRLHRRGECLRPSGRRPQRSGGSRPARGSRGHRPRCR